MANYYGTTRTNYFRVTDEKRFRRIVEKTVLDDGKLLVFEREKDGQKYFGFGFDSAIQGLRPIWDLSEKSKETDEIGPGDYEPSYDLFEYELRQILHPDDAIIITEVGSENLRYLVAYSIIITKNGSEHVCLEDSAIEKAQELLKNPDWRTKMDY